MLHRLARPVELNPSATYRPIESPEFLKWACALDLPHHELSFGSCPVASGSNSVESRKTHDPIGQPVPLLIQSPLVTDLITSGVLQI